MKNVDINFTQEEAQATVNLINEAIKKIGLDDGGNSAKNGVYLVEKIMKAFPSETPKEARDKVVKKNK